ATGLQGVAVTRGRGALAAGPLLLGLLLFVPLVQHAPDSFRNAALAAGLGGLTWCLPFPYATGLGILVPATTCAGAAAVDFLAQGRFVGRVASVFVVLGALVSLLITLTLGPDVLGGA